MLTSKIKSIVIVDAGKGYKASLRFTDPSLDREFGKQSKYMLYEEVERYIAYGANRY
jgi:hypothetical protein